MLIMFAVPVIGVALLPAPGGWMALTAWALMAAGYLPTLRYYRRSPGWAALLPVVGLWYLGAVWTSVWRYYGRAERASWRGRTYAAGGQASS